MQSHSASRRGWVRTLPAVVMTVLLSAASLAGASNRVEIVVNPQLWAGGQITANVYRYMADLQFQGYQPTLTTQSFANPQSLRSHLADRYHGDGLAGAVFIGNLPVQRFDRPADGAFGADYFPIDLYYKDLDGIWSDASGNGRLDTHSGHVQPEIFIGRLTAHTNTGLHAGRTEASLINDYLDRNHQYRHGLLGASNDSLAYIDDDWYSHAPTWANHVGLATTGDVILFRGSDATAAGYKNELSNYAYEHVLVGAHSNTTRHDFKNAGSVHNRDLVGLDGGSLFYNLFACSSARYNSSNNLGAEYIFGSDGLIAVGTTKTGSMLNFNDYYGPLGQGETFGDAMLHWWNQRLRWGTSSYNQNWFYGMTMMGDPLLLTQAYIPEPGTFVLLVVGGLGTLAVRRRRRAA